MPLTDGMWKGRRCFILGGGPSMGTLDLSKLKGELTLGANMAFLHDPTINLVYDLRLIQKLSSDARWEAYRGVKLWLNYEIPKDPWRPPGTLVLREAARNSQAFWSRALSHGLFRGTNVGVAALNLAELLGADPIYLLGFDMATSRAGAANWHTEYGQEWLTRESFFRQCIEEFGRVAKSVKVRVINLNPMSGLRCFPFSGPDEIIEGLGPRFVDPASGLPMPTSVIRNMEGLGDNIYSRPVVKHLAACEGSVYVVTPWPQLFADIPGALPVPPENVHYRTQRANMDRQRPDAWHLPAGRFREVNIGYSLDDPTLLESVMRHGGVPSDKVDFGLMPDAAWTDPRIAALPRPLGVVHPPSVRAEWTNHSRNPQPEYIQSLITSRPDVHWVSVGWNAPGVEWYEQDMEGISTRFDHGELPLESLIALVARADIVVTAPGYLLPLAAALQTPVFVVFGGSITPAYLIDPRMGDRIAWAAPQQFCRCLGMEHNCNKSISPEVLLEGFKGFAARVGVGSKKAAPRQITLNVCQGVGDIFWVYQKFAPHFDRIHFRVCALDATGEIQARALPFLRLMPKVGRVSLLRVGADRYKSLICRTFPMSDIMARYDAGETVFDYSCNDPLERGVRLEDIDPTYAVQTDVPVMESPQPAPFDKYAALYVSGSAKNPACHALGAWLPDGWVRLVSALYAKHGLALPIVMLGASYDSEAIGETVEGLRRIGIQTAALINLAPARVLHVLRHAEFFIGFQSGLNVLADNANVRQLMVYYDSLARMQYAWCKKANRDNGTFKAALFSQGPEGAIEGFQPIVSGGPHG